MAESGSLGRWFIGRKRRKNNLLVVLNQSDKVIVFTEVLLDDPLGTGWRTIDIEQKCVRVDLMKFVADLTEQVNGLLGNRMLKAKQKWIFRQNKQLLSSAV